MKKIYTLLVLLPALAWAANSSQEEYTLITSSYEKKDWKGVIETAKNSLKGKRESPFIGDMYFMTAVAYYNQGDFTLAEQYFSNFLEKSSSPKYFEDSIIYKFKIAEAYENGAGKHLMGYEFLPKWASAEDEAMTLYDEVIATLPHHEVAAKALANKSRMKWRQGKYKDAVDHYQTLITRFPKNVLTPEAYTNVAKIYLQQSKEEFAGVDLIEHAFINLKKFKADFPGDEKVLEAENLMVQMQDLYAKDLWESATYFEKKQKTQSARLYYEAIVQRYPSSQYVNDAKDKLEVLTAVLED